MTVESPYQPAVSEGDGDSTDFAIPFRFDSPNDVRCVIYAVDGTERVPAFTVTGNGSPGGTLTITDEAPAVGEQVFRYRTTALRQPVNYEAGNFPSATHERAADRLTLAAQDRAAASERSVRFDFRTAPIAAMPPIEVGRLLIRTATGVAGGPTADDIASAQGFASSAKQYRDTAKSHRDTAEGYRDDASQSATAAAGSESAVANSASAAASSANNALGYRNTAKNHRDDASQSATAAAGSATDAAGSAGDAAGSATAAAGSAGDAAGSATAAAGSATDAAGYRDTAESHRDDAGLFRNLADNFATQAGQSATAAGGSATAAAGSATAAAGSESAVAASATAAAGSATAAAGSATAAAGSASAAEGYRDTAESHRDDASQSATDAAGSADDAANSASAASSSASDALGYRNTAKNHSDTAGLLRDLADDFATAAGQSATAAGGSATAAAGSATAAAGSAANAAAAETNAAGWATAAAGSESAVAASATAAAGSATDAAQHASAAEASSTSANNSKTSAEAAQAGAVAAQQGAEGFADAAAQSASTTEDNLNFAIEISEDPNLAREFDKMLGTHTNVDFQPTTDANGRGKDLVAVGDARIPFRDLIPVDRTRRLRLTGRVHLNSAATNELLYLGFTQLDENGSQLTPYPDYSPNDYINPNIYLAQSGPVNFPADTWTELSGEVDMGTLRRDAVYLRRLAMVNFSGDVTCETRLSYFQIKDLSYAAEIEESVSPVAATMNRGGTNGVLSDQYLTDKAGWQNWGIGPTMAPNPIYPSGNSATWNLDAGESGGMRMQSDYSARWLGMANATAYRVEVEFTLVSGDIEGAGVTFRWRDSTTHEVKIGLSDMVPGADPIEFGKVYLAEHTFDRPASVDVASFDYNQVYFMANWGAFPGGLPAKELHVHRIQFYPITSTEAALADQAQAALDAVAAIPAPAPGAPVGALVDWMAGAPLPENWLEADGSTVQVNDHPELFVILGRQFGGTVGTELLSNGAFTSGLSGWIKSGPVTATANDTITIGSTSFSLLAQNITPSVVPTKMVVEVDVDSIASGDTLELVTPPPDGGNVSAAPPTISMNTPGLHRAYVAVDEFPTGLNFTFYTNATSSNIVINSASVSEGGTFVLPTLASGAAGTIKIIYGGPPA